MVCDAITHLLVSHVGKNSQHYDTVISYIKTENFFVVTENFAGKMHAKVEMKNNAVPETVAMLQNPGGGAHSGHPTYEDAAAEFFAETNGCAVSLRSRALIPEVAQQ